MEKINKFGIILIIASPGKHYNLLKKVLLLFMNSNPNFVTYFIYGKTNKKKIFPSKYDLFFPNIKESLIPGISQKTVTAIKYINHKYNYNYMIRTNLSTFWRLEKLYSFLKELPNINCACGNVNKWKKKKQFISGTGMIFSKDVCDYIYLNKQKILFSKLPDDVTISYVVRKKYKLINKFKRNSYFTKKNVKIFKIKKKKKYFYKINIPMGYFCYRLKSKKNRINDHKNMFKLFRYFYSIKK